MCWSGYFYNFKRKTNFKGAVNTIFKESDFHWKKTINNIKVLNENLDIQKMWLKYLKTLVEFRKTERTIIYIEKAYVYFT